MNIYALFCKINVYLYKNKHKIMEKEALLSKISEGLGSTQLSAQTISAFVDDVYEDVKDSESVSDEFIARKVNYLRSVNGQLHADVAAQVNDYKSKNPYKKPKEEPKVDNGEPEWFKAYREEQENRLKAMEESQKAEQERKSIDEIRSSVRKGIKAKFKDAEIDLNNYFLDRAMDGIEITLKDENGNAIQADIDGLIKQTESAYYRNLKEAGIDKPMPRRGGVGGGTGSDTWLDAKFKQKSVKEGWAKK